VVDVSGSMREQNRLELVKHALRLLVSQLDARDTIAIVKFTHRRAARAAETSAAQRTLIERAINRSQPDGSTNSEAGLRHGLRASGARARRGANNRVVLLSDGVANVGETDAAGSAMVERSASKGIYLNTSAWA
jgi:Ca-activated chloride channel family protein